ncbi:uncharacterized protein LOC128743708 [Sabethes cyaneus]|uniref:uncharacterized protein LOC128743708 n=1 Tax=Sabethes cyaneus TaxID=53552 RepID=UPI00237DCDA6|nr:uncharacterized protein LOC128743708 [Sabethes cyaneus]
MRRLLSQIYCQSSVSRQMIDTFRTSLQEYNTNYLPESNPAKNEITELLLNRDQPFLYFIWMGQIWNVVTNFIDGRQSELGGQFPRLIIPIIQRQAGIILFHKRHQRQILSVTDVKLAIKLSHSSEYEEKTYPAQFPEHISPPELPDLYSSEAELRENLFTTKIKLYCWIACNELDHRVLETIPERLRVTATTLYFLMENQILQLFEADVILQVAYEVIHETYDFRKIQHPSHLDSRAFHVIFVYEEFYNYFLDAFKLVGLDEKHVCNYPPLDGVLFHNKYAEWKEGKGDLKQISSWRIYENIPQRDA